MSNAMSNDFIYYISGQPNIKYITASVCFSQDKALYYLTKYVYFNESVTFYVCQNYIYIRPELRSEAGVI